LYWPPQLEMTKHWWKQHGGVEVFWPWFTLIGGTATLLVAWLVSLCFPKSPATPEEKPR
jgi:hypothetical protein